MVSPGREFTQPGLSSFGKRTRKPNSVYAVIPLGAALPRTLISDLPGGFGHCLTPQRRRPVAGGPAGAAFRRRAGTGREPCSGSALPSLFGLAPCGVYPASGLTAGAVRSYRTLSPLPQRRAGKPTRGCPPKRGSRGGIFSVALAVREPLRSRPGRYPAHCPSEFGLSSPGALACARASGSDRPVLLPASSLPRKRLP